MKRFRPRPRAARATLLWALGTFAVLQLALGGVVQDWLPQFRDPFFEVRARALRRRLQEAPVAPELVVMLGSSRTMNALRGAEVEAELTRARGRPVIVYNLGIPGAGPTTELLLLNRLQTSGIRPDLVLVEVLPRYLGAQSAEQKPGRGEWLTARDLACLKEHGLPCERVAAERRRALLAPWYAYRVAIISGLAPRLLPGGLRQDWAWKCDASGWLPLPEREPTAAMRRDARAFARQEYEHVLENFQLGGPSCQALRALLATCRREHLSAALVLMPEGPAFRSWYPPETLAQLHGFLADLHAEFGCPVVDARDWVPEEGFKDSHHTLRLGTDLFTRRLAEEAILPLLNAAPCQTATGPAP